MTTFKVGDRVVTTHAPEHRPAPGAGEVISINGTGVLVYFPKWGHGHSKENSCWYFDPKALDHADAKEEELIFSVGDTGFTRCSDPFLVVAEVDSTFLTVDIKGVRHGAHCYRNGRCYRKATKQHPDDLVSLVAPPNPLVTHVYKDPPMLIIENRTFINGSDAKDYNDDMLIKKISETEAEIAKLKAIETKSEKITSRIAELEAGTKRLAEILDARTAP